MSIASEITRLQNDKAAMCTAIENKGVTVGNVTLDSYASCIDAIEQGGAECVVDFLLIGGGGSGGASYTGWGAGGGGAGGVIYKEHFPLNINCYCVVVGSGGAAVNSCHQGCNGGDTCFASNVAKGGGGGGRYGGCADGDANKSGWGSAGGSGGGAAMPYYTACNFSEGGVPVEGQGNYGGFTPRLSNNTCRYQAAGGGGGAGGTGYTGILGWNSGTYCNQWNDYVAMGGKGIATYIRGYYEEFAGGGGGGGQYANTVCIGGYQQPSRTFGGGYGGLTAQSGTSATTCGSGGGGNGGCSASCSGAGAGGIAIIRYRQDGSCGITCATGGTKTCCNGYVIHTFTGGGCFCVVC